MSAHYLLVEAINFDQSIYDTNQLSVIRGGSRQVKKAIEAVTERLEKSDTNKAISTGGSSGFYRVEAEDVDALKNDIGDQLNRLYPYHSFFVGSVPIPPDKGKQNIGKAFQQLLNNLRIKQMQMLSVLPEPSPGTRGSGVCQTSGLRSANATAYISTQKRSVSKFVHQRLKEGRKARQDSHLDSQAELDQFPEELRNMRFTQDINTLADNLTLPKLNNKIAVIHLDGNNFGSLRGKKLSGAKKKGSEKQERAFQAFDESLQSDQQQAIGNILLTMHQDQRGFFESTVILNSETGTGAASTATEVAMRFETLLRGGDELTFIVPAWNGFALLDQLFQELPRGQRTYCAGLVFANAKLPIRRLKGITEQIVNQVKKKSGRGFNAWDYAVFESIDVPGSLDEFHKSQYGAALARIRKNETYFKYDKAGPGILEQQWSEIYSDDCLSTSQLYKLSDAATQFLGESDSPRESSAPPWVDDSEKNEPTPLILAERRWFGLLSTGQRDKTKATLEGLAQTLNIDLSVTAERAWFWCHLRALKDYLLRERKEPAPKSEPGEAEEATA